MGINFEKSTNENIFINSLNRPQGGNFFVKPEKTVYQVNINSKKNLNANRLNDFDSNIIENNAYLEISDEMFKIEYKIGLLEAMIAKIKTEIEGLENLGQKKEVLELIARKTSLEKDLKELNEEYSKLGVSAKISSGVANVANFASNKKIGLAIKIKSFIAKKVLAKISKKFSQNLSMKEALEKLSNINSNVDELITMRVPYGEKIPRYEKLAAYLNKANTIHSQILKNIEDLNGNKLSAKINAKSKMI